MLVCCKEKTREIASRNFFEKIISEIRDFSWNWNVNYECIQLQKYIYTHELGGQEALDQWLKYQEALVWCVMQNFESGEIEREIRAKEKTGDLDLVFKKYCG